MGKKLILLGGSLSSLINAAYGLFIIMACNDGMCGIDSDTGYLYGTILATVGGLGLLSIVLRFLQKRIKKYLDPIIIINLVVVMAVIALSSIG